MIIINVSIKEFLKTKYLDLSKDYYYIIVDITKEEFLLSIEILYNDLLYILYLYEKKYKFSSLFFELKPLGIAPLLMHTNMDAVNMHLYLEAFNSLIYKDKHNLNNTNKYEFEILNKEQKAAVDYLQGPICLLAPAGSGKTKTLINRVVNLLNHEVNPDEILVLAFNKKAEIELIERLNLLVKEKIEIKTFHSFGYNILKNYTNLSFYKDEVEVMKENLLETAISKYQNINFEKNNYLKEYKELLSKCKNEILNKENMIIKIENKQIDFYPIFKEYIYLIEKEEICDFDDMIYLVNYILLKNYNLRKKIREKYKYILVDEYQDLNPLQHLFVKIISLPYNNLFVVGDDDQAIYSFRGASNKEILKFKKSYPAAKIYNLIINYRSEFKIVEYSKRLINHNKNRYSKDFVSNNNISGEIEVIIKKDINEEMEELFKRINLENRNKKIIILYRYNEYGRLLNKFFNTKGYKISDDSNFKLPSNIEYYINFFTDKTKEIKYFDQDFNTKIDFSNKKDFYKHIKRKNKRLYNNFVKIERILARKDMSLKLFLLLLNIEIENSDLYNSFVSIYNGVKNYINQSSENNFLKIKNLECMSIHKSKGLESDIVYYFHLTLKDKIEIEEERRVNYVALTRAKEKVIITTSIDENHLFLKEYLLNDSFCNKTKKDLLNLKRDYINDEMILVGKRKLVEKNINHLYSNYNYSISENDNSYSFFENEINNINSKLNTVKKEINDITDEINYRDKLSCK